MHRLSEIFHFAKLYQAGELSAEGNSEYFRIIDMYPDLPQMLRNRKEAMERARDGRSIACTTKEMREIAREAHRRGLNRQLTPAQFKLLDPKGTHILGPMFMHDKADGKPVEPHVRCQGHLKLLGKGPAVERLLDVPMQFLSTTMTDEAKQEAWARGRATKAVEAGHEMIEKIDSVNEDEIDEAEEAELTEETNHVVDELNEVKKEMRDMEGKA